MQVSGGMKSFEMRAAHEAKQRQQQTSTAHLLLVMLQRGGVTGAALGRAGLRESDLLLALKAVEGESQSVRERAFERARQFARQLGAPEADERHLLYAIVGDPRSHAYRSMSQLGVDLDGLAAGLRRDFGLEAPVDRDVLPVSPVRKTLPPARSQHRSAIPQLGRGGARPSVPSAGAAAEPRGPSRAPSAQVVTAAAPVVAEAASATPTPARNVRVARAEAAEAAPRTPFSLDPSRYPLLAQLGRNLTELAFEGKLDDAPGREAELERVLDILARRRSNNPILVGPPGVGKTAVVEALARRLAASPHPESARVVIELSPSALTSGTGVRGALADKMKKLRAEVERSEGRIVLFLDEIHTLVGSGTDGADDLANQLKAAFARGELPCIGATTDDEYRKVFERDAALARRFSPVAVEEPTPDAAMAMLERAIVDYERHHAVRYEREALRSAVELTVRFIADRRLPDKAVSALDQAGARVSRRGGAVVDRREVASVVSEWARVPLDRLLLRDSERLLGLERDLSGRIVGHAAALARIADALRKGAAGFRGKRPLSTLLFLGPTGVGKTETAKAISDVFFGAAPMTRIDMSELSEAHSVARLLGAPPGYVGHDDGGQLTEAVRKRPYQLVLLDEIEKAHPDVLLSLLPLLDEGRVTDGRGRTVDFTNTVLVLTSNLGVREAASRPKSIGFGARDGGTTPDSAASRTLEAARRALPPELWNRIDEPLHFAALTRDDVGEVARRMIASVGRTLLAEHGVTLRVDESAIDALLAAGGYDEELGARPMRRAVGRLVESRLASLVLDGSLHGISVATLRGNGTELDVELDARLIDAAE